MRCPVAFRQVAGNIPAGIEWIVSKSIKARYQASRFLPDRGLLSGCRRSFGFALATCGWFLALWLRIHMN